MHPSQLFTAEEQEEHEHVHEHAQTITRTSLRTLMPTYKKVFAKLFKALEVVEPTYKDIMLLYRCCSLQLARVLSGGTSFGLLFHIVHPHIWVLDEAASTCSSSEVLTP